MAAGGRASARRLQVSAVLGSTLISGTISSRLRPEGIVIIGQYESHRRIAQARRYRSRARASR